MNRPILVVDDLPDKLDFLVTVIQSVLGRGCNIIQAKSYDEAKGMVQTRGSEFAIAVIDAYLTEPPGKKLEGLLVASQLKEVNPGCHVILVSRHIKDQQELRNDAPIDNFVHLVFSSGSNVVVNLRKALERALSRTTGVQCETVAQTAG